VDHISVEVGSSVKKENNIYDKDDTDTNYIDQINWHKHIKWQELGLSKRISKKDKTCQKGKKNIPTKSITQNTNI